MEDGPVGAEVAHLPPSGIATRWLGAVEGYYGQPLSREARAELVEWLGGRGFNCYAYAPKHDPYHRDRWREPYPSDELAGFAELVTVGKASGAELGMGVSPGLDWRPGDEEPLIAKLAAFHELGVRVLAVAFDDVPPGGHDLGAAHGAAVAAAVTAIGGQEDGPQWITCPTDYATPVVTPYLQGFVAELPEEVAVMWTGPSIVSPRVTGADAARFGAELGRAPLFAENFPVNDGGMEGVLHIGPYPDRTADLPEATAGVFCNFMRHPLASRIGLAGAARFWQEPASDRETVWREVLAEHPGLAPLALACRAWIGDPAPAPEILEWAEAAVATGGADARLRDFLCQGCREGLDPALAAEVEPWLEQWDRQSHAMQFALHLLARAPARPVAQAFAMQTLWQRAGELPQAVFGVRAASYPVTTWADSETQALPEGIVRGDNLTDRLCELALGVRSTL